MQKKQHKKTFSLQLESSRNQRRVFFLVQRMSVITIASAHLALSDGTLCGGKYEIPRGTWILCNWRAVMMDPEVFQDPEAFRPERFISQVREYAGTL